MKNVISVARPPKGFAIDPGAPADPPKAEKLTRPLAVQPIMIGFLLEEIKGGQNNRVLQAKGGLEQRFSPVKTSA